MTDTLEQPDTTVTVQRSPSRLNQAAAWVAIVAGVVFIVGSVFFTGYFLGRHSGHGNWGHGGGRHHGGPGTGQMMPMPPMMAPGPGMPPPPGPNSPTAKP